MSQNKGEAFDFSDFLMDDEFIKGISDRENARDYINDLKINHPDKAEDIELAVKVFYELKNVSKESSNSQRKNLWDKILLKRARERRIQLFRIAASFILLAGLGGSAMYFFTHDQKPAIEKFALSTNPTFDQSQLILSDGQKIIISDYESKVTYSSDGSNVIVNDSTELVQEIKPEIFNQMIVPYGKYNNLQLSDGTKVWVNSGSCLVYPPVFSGKTREVYVQGEAYFEVAEDKTKPFFVKTDQFRVEVTGTRFCIQANEKEELFTALLLEGEVSVTSSQGKLVGSEKVKLNPGQLASLKVDGKNFHVLSVEYPENYIAWKNGYLLFNEEPINEVLKRVSRFYNINIEFRGSSKPLHISGKLDLKDEPERVLKGISTIAKSNLVNENGNFVIY